MVSKKKKSRKRSPTPKSPDPIFFIDRDLAGKTFLHILRDAGLRVESHNDHFNALTPDLEWLEYVGERGWIALTHDKRIRKHSFVAQTMLAGGVKTFLLIGAAPHAELATNFVNTAYKVKHFAAEHPGPFIAKVARPKGSDNNADSPGTVEMWISPSDWQRRFAVERRTEGEP